MKKKILTIALVVALIAVAAGGTLAWFTAEDSVANTFTVGSVKIEIHENGEPTDEDTITFEEPFIPVVNMDDPAADENYIPKVVTVQNTGANAAYIRTHIAIPTDLVGYLYLDLSASGWTRLADSTATVDGVSYTVFSYNYDTAVKPDEFTTELLTGAYLGSSVDLVEDANGNLVFALRKGGKVTETSAFVAHKKADDGTYTSEKVTILVASEAIQAQGFSDAAAALSSGFPNANPWAQ